MSYPVLFDKCEKAFTTNGIGRLSDAISCIVTEERNSTYELEMVYPQTGIHYEDISIGSIIYARHSDKTDSQAFQVYKLTENFDGTTTINAEHISYRLNKQVLKPMTATGVVEAMEAFPGNIVGETGFTFETDRTTTGTFKTTEPLSVRAALGGTEGSILDTYGAGEYEWDNFVVRFWGNRGADNGVVISYGKNLTDFVNELDGSEIYTAMYPYYKSQDEVVHTMSTDDGVVFSSYYDENDPQVVPISLNDYIEPPEDAAESWYPTDAVMKSTCDTLFSTNLYYLASQNLEISFVQLWNTEEYEGIAPLQRVGLCDWVHVKYEKLGMNVVSKVIKTEYNVLLDRYDSMELGEPKASLSETLLNGINETIQVLQEGMVTKTQMESAIDNATDIITGASGNSKVQFIYSGDTLTAIKITDADNDQNQWLWNSGGLAFSSDGGTTYTTAITKDGKIVADMITTGTLTADVIDVAALFSQEITASHLTLVNGTNYSVKTEAYSSGLAFYNLQDPETAEERQFGQIGFYCANTRSGYSYLVVEGVNNYPVGFKCNDDIIYLPNSNGDNYLRHYKVDSDEMEVVWDGFNHPVGASTSRLASDYTSTTTDYKQLSMDTNYCTTGKCSYDANTSEIVCEVAGYVEVSAQALFNKLATGLHVYDLSIRQNGRNVQEAASGCYTENDNSFCQLTIAPQIVHVAAGDAFTLWAKTRTSGDKVMSGSRTHLTVKYI